MRRRRCRRSRRCCKKARWRLRLPGDNIVRSFARWRYAYRAYGFCRPGKAKPPPGKKDRRELNQTLQPINPLQRLSRRQGIRVEIFQRFHGRRGLFRDRQQ